jgi:Zn-dependent peptidase ImmA (M78 family)/transcriptional regulator with XRE-family HTH domain
MDMSTGELAVRVADVIGRSGLKQGEFAALIGIDAAKLSKSLRGVRRFTSLDLAMIAERGGVTVDWLLTGQGRSRPAVAARAAAVDEEAVPRATARAEHLDELWLALLEIDAIALPPRLPAVPLRGLMIEQGAELARRAWDVVRERDRAADVTSDLPAVLESVFGVNVEVDELGPGLDGISYRRDDFRLALVASAAPLTRQRFTMAHELGHLLAGDADGVRIDHDVMGPTTRQDRVEMRANAFAAAFLMPTELVDASVDQHRFVQLMGELRVSASALAWRLFSLGLVDGETRRRLASTSLRAAALHGGWLDDFRAHEAERGATRPCMRLVDAAVAAYERRDISVRPLAAILNRSVEEVLVALEPSSDQLSAAAVDIEEPVFTP